jgi:hypothetical protein
VNTEVTAEVFGLLGALVGGGLCILTMWIALKMARPRR